MISFSPAAKLHKRLLSKHFEMAPTRDGYGQGLVEAGERDKNVVVLCCDLADSTRSQWFAQQFPDRFIEVGVAEQNLAGLAAGMALNGKIPFISSYAVFSPGRNWDQIRVSVCYNKSNVKIAGAHAGISVGPDGATHQALEDMALMRVLPRMTVISPCDVHEARKATMAAARYQGPVYIRFAREKTPIVTTTDTPFAIGKVLLCKEGKDVTLLATGPLLYETICAASALHALGVDVQVVNCPTLKPLDEVSLLRLVKYTRAVVTIEEHQIQGGLFGAVSELFSQKFPVPIVPIGMPDSFGESGEPHELLEKYGMTSHAIVSAAQKVLQLKARL